MSASPRTRRSRPLAAIVALLGAAVLAGCGAAPGINGAGDTAVDPAGSAIKAVNPYGADPAAEGQAKSGGTLVMGTDREAVSFDPTVQNTNQAATAVYDSLLKLDDKGQPQPYLAQSMDSSDNGLTWRMGLRPGVTFSDGTPLDANAVIVNVQRHIDKATSPGHLYAAQIASMRPVDPQTVEFVLKAPFGAFPSVFALSFTSGNLGTIISPAALQQYGKDIGMHPVGAGPFVLSNWVRDSKMSLTKNPTYWQKDKGLPHLDGLEFRPLPDTETRYASIVNGDVDEIFAGYQTELYRALQAKNLNVYYGPGNGAEYVYFNFQKAPFDDRRMREAFVRGIDLNALAATQYNGQMAQAKGWFGDDSPYTTEQSRDAWPAFDVEKAKALVADYVKGGGSATVQYKTTNAPNRVAFAEFLQAQMAAIGITLQPQFFDLAQYSSSVVQSKDFQIAGWVGGPVDVPYPAVQNLLHTGGNTNYGSYSNPQVDQLLDEAAATTDDAKRTADYQQAQLLTNQDIPVAYYSRGYLSTIAKPEVKGVVRYLSRDQFFATTWLDR
jgi:ABC-type transport system substrate-binding protein